LRRRKTFYFGGVLAVLAGGLGVVLGGPVRYSSDDVEDHGWIGPEKASARLVPEDLIRAAMLQYVFFICMLAAISLFIIM
jgi:cobalamin biosynthesis protein CobD/CbiB